MAVTVSVLIPAHNRERFIAEAIESVLRQTRPADEIIVVDDGSTDGTAAVARSFPGVEVVRLDDSLGAAGARNVALARSRGDLLAWLDSDDLWLPDHLETLVGLLEQHPTAIVAYSNTEYFGNREGPVILPEVPVGVPFTATQPAFRQIISTMIAAVMRRTAIQAICGFDNSLRAAVDFDLFLRLTLEGPFVCTRRVTARYRLHGDQISARIIVQNETKYFARRKFIETLATTGRTLEAQEFTQRIVDCLHKDWWAAWTRGDPDELASLVRLAAEYRRLPGVPNPLARRSIARFRQYCATQGKLQGWDPSWASSSRFLGRPRWLVKRTLALDMRYRWSRLSDPAEVWIGRLVESAYAWGRIMTSLQDAKGHKHE